MHAHLTIIHALDMVKPLSRLQWAKMRKRQAPKLYVRLWNVWTRESDQIVPQVDWEGVLRQVRRKPRITRYQDEERQGMFLLHLVCALKPPVRVLAAVLRANPQAIRHQSITAGLTPLHIAVGRNASVASVRLLIQQNPESILVSDTTGLTPIFWACRSDVSEDLVRLLLEFDPSLASTRRRSVGLSPLERFFSDPLFFLMRFSRLGQLAWNTHWTKLTYLMWAAHYGTVTAPRNGQFLSTLHAALALAAPTWVIQEAVRIHAQDSSGIRDTKGNYPLHYAVQTPNASRQAIVALLQFFPEAASIPDNRGRLPLHEALKHGRLWNEGLQELFYAYPASIAELDAETCMLPVALAADRCDLSTTYALFREYPQVLRTCPKVTTGAIRQSQ